MIEVRELPLDGIQCSTVLRRLNETVVEGLSRSIRANGLLQPILVRRDGIKYEVVFGHHRLEACRHLGWKSITAIVEEMSDDDSFIARVVENIQRNNDVDPIMEAQGYARLVDNGWTINKIAQKIGKSDSYVSDRIGLIRHLHPEIIREVQNGSKHLKVSHLELLARLRSRKVQRNFSLLVEKKHLSVRKLEELMGGGAPLIETIRNTRNSLHIPLPQGIAKQMHLHAGDAVYIYIQTRKRIAIEPIHRPMTDLSPIACESSLDESLGDSQKNRESRF